MVPGSIPGDVTGDFFRGSPRQSHVPWGWLSHWKWVPGISPGAKAACAYGWWPITLVVPNVKKIRGLNLPGTPSATSACCGITFTLLYLSFTLLVAWHKCCIFIHLSTTSTLLYLITKVSVNTTINKQQLCLQFYSDMFRLTWVIFRLVLAWRWLMWVETCRCRTVNIIVVYLLLCWLKPL